MESKLDAAASALFHRQIGEINLIQRLADDKEVNCYVMHRGKVQRNPAFQFPNAALDLRIASVKIRSNNVITTANLYCTGGFFFCILFDKRPSDIQPPYVISELKIEGNPMECQIEDSANQLRTIN